MDHLNQTFELLNRHSAKELKHATQRPRTKPKINRILTCFLHLVMYLDASKASEPSATAFFSTQTVNRYAVLITNTCSTLSRSF